MVKQNIFVASSRRLFASPAWSSTFELEDLLVDYCDAKLLCPQAKSLYQYSQIHSGYISKIAGKISRVLNNSFQSIDDIHIPDNELNALFCIEMSPSTLEKVDAISGWRERFDLVVAYIEDCWLLASFPDLVRQFDHLLIPYDEFRAELESYLDIPVSVLPYGFDVLDWGAGDTSRTIDVASFGRIPKNYYLELTRRFNSKESNFIYYHQVPESTVRFPTQTYTPARFDYLHRVQLKKLLQRSRINLAFDFDYTLRQEPLGSSMKKHPSYKCGKSLLTRRWFESASMGSAVVGTRPKSEMMKTYFGWQDSTIELPDNEVAGVSLIHNLLSDRAYLNTIHHRNYIESLSTNDWRLRIRDMFKLLNLDLPDRMGGELRRLEEKIERSKTLLQVS
jgi:hypothetical protein